MPWPKEMPEPIKKPFPTSAQELTQREFERVARALKKIWHISDAEFEAFQDNYYKARKEYLRRLETEEE